MKIPPKSVTAHSGIDSRKLHALTAPMISCGKTVCDHFPLIQEMNRRLDKVRIRVMKSFRKGSDGYYLLKKFNWLIFKEDSKLLDPNMKKKYNYHFKIKMNYYDIYLKLRDVHPHLATAWSLKDAIVDYYENCTLDNAKEELLILIQKFYKCGVEEMTTFGDTLAH